MKTIKLFTIVFMTICLSMFQMSCSSEDVMVETSKAPFAELQANVNRINAKYEKEVSNLYLQDNSRYKASKFWKWLGKWSTIVIGDAIGTASFGTSGLSINFKQGIDVSSLIKKEWEKKNDPTQPATPAEPENPNDTISNNPSGGNKIIVNTDALPELNGNLIEDNAGYIHNAVIINLYEKFGDALNEFSDLELANAINSEYDEVVRNSNLISNATIENDIDIEAVNNFISLVGSCNDVDEFISRMSREYPACRNELEVIGSVLKQLAEKDIDEDIIDDYVEEIIYAIKSSAIPNNSKDVLKSIISVAGASRQIWDLE